MDYLQRTRRRERRRRPETLAWSFVLFAVLVVFVFFTPPIRSPYSLTPSFPLLSGKGALFDAGNSSELSEISHFSR